MDLSDLTSAFALQALDQSHRAVRLMLGGKHGAVLDRVLLPQFAHIREAACEGIRARVVCLSTRADLPLQQFKGLPVEVQLVTDTGDLRRVCGIVTGCRELESDGGATMIELTAQDAFGVMSLGRRSRSFLDKSALDIARIVLDGWRGGSSTLARAFEYKLLNLDAAKYPARAFTFQFNESDSQFLQRILAREGIAWFFRPGAAGDVPVHELVLFDDTAVLPENAAGTVRFHRRDGTEQRDTINLLSPAHALVEGSVSRHSYDHEVARVDSANDFALVDQGEAGNDLAALLRDVRIDIPHAGDDREHHVRLTRVDMQRHEHRAERWHGVGGVRSMAVCEWNTVTSHPRLDGLPPAERQLVCIELEHWAQNNLPKEMNERLRKLLGEQGEAPAWARQGEQVGSQQRYSNRFVAVPRKTRITPAFDKAAVPHPPMLTAIVVGPEGEPVYCDDLGRVKVRFAGMENGAGTLATDDTEADTAWVRVDYLWAGEGFGVIFPLRPGMEVDIGFANGDPDRPVITGSRYNHSNPPPRFNHLGALPENRALSGIVTREFKGSRQQQLCFDDTEGAINVQLASDHRQSELNLGFLRTPMDKGQADPRGEGIELRTLAATVMRAAQGILLLTEAHATPQAKQLQREELKASLAAAVALMERLDGAAKTAKAHDSDIASMKKLGDDLGALEAGTNVAEGKTGGQQPVIGIAGTAGVAITTPKSTLLATGENLDIAVNGNLQQAVNRQWTLNAGGTLSWFAAGQTLPNPKAYTVSLIAGAGAMLVQAQKGPIHLEAEQEIRIGSNATVKVDAQGAVVLTEAGGAQLEMKGGNVTLRMPGTYTVHAAAYNYVSAASAAATLPNMPGSEQLRDWLGLHYLDPETGEGIDGAPYEVRYGGGATLTGTLDMQGKAKHPNVPNFKLKEVIYKPRPPKQDKEYDPLEKLL